MYSILASSTSMSYTDSLMLVVFAMIGMCTNFPKFPQVTSHPTRNCSRYGADNIYLLLILKMQSLKEQENS